MKARHYLTEHDVSFSGSLKGIMMKYALSILMLLASHFAFAEGSLKMEEVQIEQKTFYYQCSLDWQIWATPIDSMKTQLAIQSNPKVKNVEIIHVLHQIQNEYGGADYIGFDNNNREYSWIEQYGNEAIFGYRDKRNRLLHLGCETKDKEGIQYEFRKIGQQSRS